MFAGSRVFEATRVSERAQARPSWAADGQQLPAKVLGRIEGVSITRVERGQVADSLTGTLVILDVQTPPTPASPAGDQVVMLQCDQWVYSLARQPCLAVSPHSYVLPTPSATSFCLRIPQTAPADQVDVVLALFAHRMRLRDRTTGRDLQGTAEAETRSLQRLQPAAAQAAAAKPDRMTDESDDEVGAAAVPAQQLYQAPQPARGPAAATAAAGATAGDEEEEEDAEAVDAQRGEQLMTVARGLTTLGEYTRAGLVYVGTAAGQGLAWAGAEIAKRVSPAEEGETQLSESTKKAIEGAKDVGKGLVAVSAGLVWAVSSAAKALGGMAAASIEGTPLGDRLRDGASTHTGRGATAVATSTAMAALSVWEGLEEATVAVYGGAAAATAQVAGKRYGKEVESAVGDGFAVGGDVLAASHQMRRTGVRTLVAQTTVETAKEAGTGADVVAEVVGHRAEQASRANANVAAMGAGAMAAAQSGAAWAAENAQVWAREGARVASETYAAGWQWYRQRQETVAAGTTAAAVAAAVAAGGGGEQVALAKQD